MSVSGLQSPNRSKNSKQGYNNMHDRRSVTGRRIIKIKKKE